MAENQETRPPTTPEPSIRTMKSDLESLIQEKKPGLTDIISQEVRRGTFKSRRVSSGPLGFLLIASAAIILAAMGAGFFFFFAATRTDQQSQQISVEKAPVFFRPDQTRTISADTADRASLLRLLDEISHESAPEGTITHASVEVRDGPQPSRPLRMQDLVEFARLGLPPALVQTLDSLPMLFVYYTQDAGSIGIAARTPRGDRAFSELFSAEPSLASWLQPLFGDQEIKGALEPFQDMTWRNIDFRFQVLSPDGDAGIAYGLFPGRQLVLISTSRAGFQAVVDRLFETR